MADSITTSRNLTITLEWQNPVDTSTTKTGTFKIPNYNSAGETESSIKEKVITALNQGLFIETTNGTVLTSDSLLTAATTNQTINVLGDIGWED